MQTDKGLIQTDYKRPQVVGMGQYKKIQTENIKVRSADWGMRNVEFEFAFISDFGNCFGFRI